MTDTLNPIWNQTFDFVVEDALHDLLMVEVWDHDTFGKVHSSSSCILFVSFEVRTLILYALIHLANNSNMCLNFSPRVALVPEVSNSIF